MKANQKRQNGFTILEVMVVLAILGMIAGMVVTNVMDNQSEAQVKKAAIDVQNIESALQMYKLKTGYYPTTEQGLESLVTQTEIEPIPRSFPANGFINRLPKDPWGEEYQLLSPGEMSVVDVFSSGPDREVGTDDDIGNWNLDDNR